MAGNERQGAGDTVERVDCPLCGGSDTKRLLEGRDLLHGVEGHFGVERCVECGFSYTNPRPKPEAIGEFYPPDYSPHQPRPKKPRGVKARLYRAVRQEYLDYPGGRGGLRKALLAPAWAVFASSSKNLFWPAFEGDGRILDVGCGAGRILSRLAAEGWSASGLDVSEAAARTAFDNYRVEVSVGTYADRHFAAGSFDVVTMWNSLEHMFDPLGVLESAGRVLAPGGSLVSSVPNFASWGAEYFGKNWFPLDLPRHLNHFTPETLRLALERAGFEAPRISPLRRTSSLRRSARYALENGDRRLVTRILASRFGAGAAARFLKRAGKSDLMVVRARKRRS